MSQILGLSLKRGFGGCGDGFSRCNGLGGLGGFGGFNRFSGFGGFSGLGGFGGFDGYPILSLKGFSVLFTLLLKVLYLLVSHPLSYTWVKGEPQISIRKERYIRRYLQYGVLVARGDINKEEDIVSTNKKLQKYCKGNEFFFIDNSNIDASCLNKSKLHFNRKGTSYLANNFRNHIFNIK